MEVVRLPSRLDISRHSRTLITPVGLPLAAWASKKLWAEMIRKRFHRIEQRPPNLNTPLAMTLNIDNPFVILGVCVFAIAGSRKSQAGDNSNSREKVKRMITHPRYEAGHIAPIIP